MTRDYGELYMITFRWTGLLEQLPRATVTMCRIFPIAAVVPAAVIEFTDLRTILPNLEDVFLKLTGHSIHE